MVRGAIAYWLPQVICWAGLTASARATLTFTVGGSWDTDARKTAATNAMQAVVDRYNAYGNFGNYNIYVYYDSGIPTAQSNYLGSIGFGGTYPNERVAQHESNHYLGSGTTTAWNNTFSNAVWTGAKANALIAQFDGDGTKVKQSGVHFYGYGLNYDSEVVNGSVLMRNIAIMYAMRQDMGLGPKADPWSATSVSLTKSDAVGTSGFNYFGGWNDNYFAHPNADYFTGDYALRTPQDTYSPSSATPSFTFAGRSLTLNNTGTPNGGLFYKGVGTTGVITINNLILAGGTIHHYSGTGDLFRLAGNVTVSAPSTIYSEQGSTNIEARLAGTAALTIGNTNVVAADNGFVRLLAADNTFTGDLIVIGRLQLSQGANLNFVIGDNGVANTVSGAAAKRFLVDGVFNVDLSHADATLGDAWTLVSAANTTYGSTFSVNGFTESTPGLWLNPTGYAYSELSGQLSYVGAALTPEPAGVGLLGASLLVLSTRRRRA